MKLYNSSIAPTPRRVRMFLAEKGLQIEMIEVDLMNAENLQDPFLRINPRGIVPVLELDDGSRIDEAAPICRYIEAIQPEPRLLGADAKSIGVIESRTRHMEIDGFQSVADVFRNSTPAFANRGLAGVKEPVAAIPQLAERGRAGIHRFFERLDDYLGASEFVAGEHYSFADITALCVVDFAGWVQATVPVNHHNTRRWYEAVASRASAKA